MMKNLLQRTLLFSFLMTAVLTFSCFVSAFAEGSKEMTQNGGYRPYLEWDPYQQTASLSRVNVLKVYVNAGEQIDFGSSVPEAMNGEDIVVRTPSGAETIYDVLADGTGLIDTYEKEQIGPYPELGGYIPLSILSEETGFWEFEFHSPVPTKKGSNGNDSVNPPAAPVSKISIGAEQGRAVAAWDITVKKDGVAIPGRTFSNYIAMNLGKNVSDQKVMNGVIYVLTKDGYQYRVDMNGLDPYGFMFFANNRGLIDSTANTSLYHNAIAVDMGNNNLLALRGNIKLQMPNVPDTETDITHYVFFNKPAEDLPVSMPTSAISPTTAQTYRFVGKASGVTDEGAGGAFNTSFDKSTTYQITIDVNANGMYDEGLDVLLANAAKPGENVIYWNGLDAQGNVVKAGTYKASLKTKGGEYHFPLLDAENNAYGIKIQLMNPPYAVEGYNPNGIYYDNSCYTAADGTYIDTNPSANGALVPTIALNGIDSSGGALAYRNAQGNNKVLDVWTYFPGNTYDISFAVLGRGTEIKLKNDYAYIYGYSDTEMAAENPIIRCEASALMHRLLKQNNMLGGYQKPHIPSYTDLDGSEWYYAAVEYMTYIGMYHPDDLNGVISPATHVTRGEAAKLFVLSLGLESTENVCFFDDLDTSHPYYNDINTLIANGYMLGDKDTNTFRPDAPMTRAEYVAVYNRIIGRDDRYDITTDVEGNPVECGFEDLEPSQWYYEDMMRATNSFTNYKVDPSKRQYRNELDEYSVPNQTSEEGNGKIEEHPISSEQ